ncbi:unnamed protein product [Vicia faba]|uniref:Uncharacterized protein n=1 Tax=Vicia faba TaxID=3906 RepID=A0AAV1BC12_VICFA|nr:unnamed protein product [Vicia faba]
MKKMKILEGLCRERGEIKDEGYPESKIGEVDGDAFRIVQPEKRFSGEFFCNFFLNPSLKAIMDWRIGYSEIDSVSNLFKVIGSETSVSIRNYYAVRNSAWSLDLL